MMGHLHSKADKFAYINLAFLLLLSIKAYPRWFMPSGVYQTFFIITTGISLIMLNPVIEKGSFKLRMLVLVFLYAVFFNLPIIHEFRPGYFLDSIIFLELLLLPASVFSDAFIFLRKVFYWVSIFAIIMWVIHILGVELPHYTLKGGEIGANIRHYYHIYGPVVSLFYGEATERVCGVFAEPGHFGIYIGLMMAINKFRFDSKEDVIMLIAGILTFSTAFFGIIGLGMIYKFILSRDDNNDYRKLIPVFLLATMVIVSSNTIQEVVIGRVVEGRQVSSVNDLVENRVQQTTRRHYEKLLKSDKIWVGEGQTETDVVQETNWRGGVYRYGILGMIIFICLILNIVSIVPLKYQLLLLSITALIMSHRIYQLFYTGLPYLIYTAALLNSKTEFGEYNNDDSNIIEEL